MNDPDSPARGPDALDCQVTPVPKLSAAERGRLFELMSRHFDQVDQAQFFADLDEKPSVLLLREAASGSICGFSTITLFETTRGGERLAAVFAGDTVVDPEYWGHPAWVYAWARYGFALAQQANADKVYLLLLTSTHRTYRFMPGFFREYYPRPLVATPADVQARLDTLVRIKFPDEYDAVRGVVALQRPTPVRDERQLPGTAPGEHAAERFFLERNPGYLNGDFLTCLAEFTWENLTPLGRRVVSAPT
ncbi:MAG TPA: hypothetical protein VHD36_07205 [Pirellulales bacterium]|nr:hypothetical protein [Pirellulales bacterium]